MKVYLDNSATTAAHPQVVEAMVDALANNYGNPSSMHSMGVQGERMLKQARKSVAKLIGCTDKEVTFTSGGTEGNNLAIFGAAYANRRLGKHIVTTAIEHPSVLNAMRVLQEDGFDITYIDSDSKGRISAEMVLDACKEDTILVSMMHVNNETGAVLPVLEVSKGLKKLKRKPLLHVDGIQAIGKLKVSVKRLGVDLYSISGHKIHGPKGIGALFIKDGVRIAPRQFGGAQEKGIRPGTENVPGIVGLGTACMLAADNLNTNSEKMNAMKAMFCERICQALPSVHVNGELGPDFAPHVVNLSFVGMRGEVLLHALESKGIYVSTGSACSSKNKSYSHVLTSMGLDEADMEGAIRFSFNAEITEAQMEYAVNTIIDSVNDLQKIIKGR